MCFDYRPSEQYNVILQQSQRSHWFTIFYSTIHLVLQVCVLTTFSYLLTYLRVIGFEKLYFLYRHKMVEKQRQIKQYDTTTLVTLNWHLLLLVNTTTTSLSCAWSMVDFVGRLNYQLWVSQLGQLRLLYLRIGKWVAISVIMWITKVKTM